MDNKIKWLNEFIAEVVDGWMLKDLERLTNDIPHRTGEAGNCNFPIALYVFSCIEFLGQLTPVNPIDTRQPGYTQTSIMGFIDDFFPDDFKQKIQPHRTNFINIFRNGLAHNYFAKYAGVSRTQTEAVTVTKEGMLVLDADRFVEAFRAAIARLKEATKTDTQLVERMVDRYDTQYQNNRLRFQTTPTITQVSTASLAHPGVTRGLISVSLPSSNNDPKTTTTLPYTPEPKNEDKGKID